MLFPYSYYIVNASFIKSKLTAFVFLIFKTFSFFIKLFATYITILFNKIDNCIKIFFLTIFYDNSQNKSLLLDRVI